MIGDAGDVQEGACLEADLCIVGAGAAGITLALQFLHGPLTVLVLESGGETVETATQALGRGKVAGPSLHPPAHTYRQRRLGGSTGIWGGRCVPFDPIDFETRDWVPASGWPFTIDVLKPYYALANRLCEAGDFAYTADSAFPFGMQPMLKQFAGENFSDTTIERFSCPTDFGRRYRSPLAASRAVRILLHANVTRIGLAAEGHRVDHLDVRTLRHRRFTVRASHTVLAAGGLETPRVLLASRDRNPAGVGNDHDQVGRHYMCHLAGTAGEIDLGGNVYHGYQRSADGVYCRRRLALTHAAQRRMRTGNFVARLHHPGIPDPSHRSGKLSALYLAKPLIGYEYARRLHGETGESLPVLAAHLGNVLREPAATACFLGHMLRHRFLAGRKFPSIIVRPNSGIYCVDFHAEQMPDPDCRVRLGEVRDLLGVPQLVIDWRANADDLHTVQTAFALLAADLAGHAPEGLRYDPRDIEPMLRREGAYGGHHIGTARMSVSPKDGVVDAECRVHGLANLWVAGSAVFPTSGQANPTLTIVALALRLADRLHRDLRSGAVQA